MRSWVDQLREPGVWDEVPMTVTPPPMPNDLAGIIALDGRLHSEAQQAQDTIDQLQSEPIVHASANIFTSDGLSDGARALPLFRRSSPRASSSANRERFSPKCFAICHKRRGSQPR